MYQHSVTENVELHEMLAWHEAASKRSVPGYRWSFEQVGDAYCSVCPTDPSILINRVMGLGSRDTPDTGQLVRIRELYEAAGISRFFLHVVPEILTPELEQSLNDAGYRKHRGWMKFVRGTGDIPASKTDLAIREIGTAEAPEFARIAAAAFDLLPASEPIVATLAEAPGWRLFMSFDGERPAGTGGLFIDGETAALDWGATDPEFRRRGSQSALLSARLQAAFEAGCTTITTVTGEAVPGDPQHSYSNILKRGFSEAYLRQNWIPADS